MDRFSQACKDIGLTINPKKTNVLAQNTQAPPIITIDYELDAVHHFTYLDSTITNNLSLATEIDKKIGKAASMLARLTTRVWINPKLTVKYTYAKQERRLNTFHLRSIRRILSISWKDRVSNAEVLAPAALPSMYTQATI